MVRGKGPMSNGFIRGLAYTYTSRVNGLGTVPRDGETNFEGLSDPGRAATSTSEGVTTPTPRPRARTATQQATLPRSRSRPTCVCLILVLQPWRVIWMDENRKL